MNSGQRFIHLRWLPTEVNDHEEERAEENVDGFEAELIVEQNHP